MTEFTPDEQAALDKLPLTFTEESPDEVEGVSFLTVCALADKGLAAINHRGMGPNEPHRIEIEPIEQPEEE